MGKILVVEDDSAIRVELYNRCVKEEYKKDDYGIKYNKISINYDTESVMYATENIVNSYLKNEGIKYENHTEKKAAYRSQLINALLENGITIVLCVIVNIVVSVILVQNRFQNRRQKLKLFKQLGMEKGKLLRICMLEGIRESLWCIITMPLIIPIQYISYKLKLRKL